MCNQPNQMLLLFHKKASCMVFFYLFGSTENYWVWKMYPNYRPKALLFLNRSIFPKLNVLEKLKN